MAAPADQRDATTAMVLRLGLAGRARRRHQARACTVFTVILSSASSFASARVKPMMPALAVTTCGRRAAAGMRGQAADVDDRAGAALLDRGRQALHAMERAVEDDADDLRAIPRRSCRSIAFSRAQRRVVDEDSRCGRSACSAAVGHRVDGGRVGDVGDDDHRLAARALDLARPRPRPRRGCERTLTTTAAPPSASASAMARPMLRPAPVMMATRPASSLFMSTHVPYRLIPAQRATRSIRPSEQRRAASSSAGFARARHPSRRGAR